MASRPRWRRGHPTSSLSRRAAPTVGAMLEQGGGLTAEEDCGGGGGTAVGVSVVGWAELGMECLKVLVMRPVVLVVVPWVLVVVAKTRAVTPRAVTPPVSAVARVRRQRSATPLGAIAHAVMAGTPRTRGTCSGGNSRRRCLCTTGDTPHNLNRQASPERTRREATASAKARVAKGRATVEGATVAVAAA